MTSRILRRFSPELPLVVRELIQMASRRRTYLLRVFYALALFALGGLIYWDQIRFSVAENTWGFLGTGGQLLEALTTMQILGIWFFLPAMVCPALTLEKERQTLPLLFLTRLRPTTLLLEKLIGRLVPMFSLVLLSLPLLTIAYALGGISSTQMLNTIWLLLVTMLQIGCLALCCSVWCRTTVSAFITSYLVTAAYVIGIPMVLELSKEMTGNHGPTSFEEVLVVMGLIPERHDGFIGFTMTLYLQLEHSRSTPFSQMVVYSLPILAVTCFAFVLARVQLVRRASLPPRNHLREFFGRVDRVLTWLNDRLTGSVMLVHDSSRLPKDEPVAWHETTKKSLGTFRYLLRVLILLEVPVLIISVIALGVGADAFPYPVSIVQVFTWLLAILIISARATTLFSGERSRQTLEILLSTPLSTRDLVVQKYRGVHRLILVLSVPLLTAIAFATYWRFEFREQIGQRINYRPFPDGFDHHPLCYMTCALLAVLIYPRMIAWLSLWIGMICRSPARAIVFSVLAIVAWCAVPALLVAWIETEYSIRSHEWVGWLLLSSPAAIIPINEFSAFFRGVSPWHVTAVNFTFYGSLTLVFRTLCLNASSQWLNRPE